MVLCATAWMISAGYIVTKDILELQFSILWDLIKLDGILDLFAMSVGILALWLLVDDTIVRALESVLGLKEQEVHEFSSTINFKINVNY